MKIADLEKGVVKESVASLQFAQYLEKARQLDLDVLVAFILNPDYQHEALKLKAAHQAAAERLKAMNIDYLTYKIFVLKRKTKELEILFP